MLEFGAILFSDTADLFAHSADATLGMVVTSETGDVLLIKNISIAELMAHPQDLHFL